MLAKGIKNESGVNVWISGKRGWSVGMLRCGKELIKYIKKVTYHAGKENNQWILE